MNGILLKTYFENLQKESKGETPTPEIIKSAQEALTSQFPEIADPVQELDRVFTFWDILFSAVQMAESVGAVGKLELSFYHTADEWLSQRRK